jgi:hypothetical protein
MLGAKAVEVERKRGACEDGDDCGESGRDTHGGLQCKRPVF